MRFATTYLDDDCREHGVAATYLARAGRAWWADVVVDGQHVRDIPGAAKDALDRARQEAA